MYDDLLGPRPTIEKKKPYPPQSSPDKPPQSSPDKRPQSSSDKGAGLRNMVATEAEKTNSDEEVDQWADIEDIDMQSEEVATEECDGNCDKCDSGDE